MGWGLSGVRGGAQTSTSARVVISPVPDWPAGVGLLDVQCSLRRGAEAEAAGASLGVVSCASLSGALVPSSVSVILGGYHGGDGMLVQGALDRWLDRGMKGYLARQGQGNGTRRHDQRMLSVTYPTNILLVTIGCVIRVRVSSLHFHAMQNKSCSDEFIHCCI